MTSPSKDPRPFKRAILKLSGEALRGHDSRDNISPEIVDRIAGCHGADQGGGIWVEDCVK